MNRSRKPNLLALLVAFTIIAIPTMLILGWLSTGNLISAIQLAVLLFVVVLFTTLMLQVLNKLGVKLADSIASLLELWVQKWFTNYQDMYLQHMERRYSELDSTSLTSLGQYNLDMAIVYTELFLVPLGGSTIDGRNTVWEYLNSPAGDGRKLVIIGEPGSGKSTLLRNIAYTVAKSEFTNHDTHRIPVLIALKPYEDLICGSKPIMLSDIADLEAERLDRKAPDGWFLDKLRKGQCVLLMDGVDEIADETNRTRVISWVSEQFFAFGKNHFVVTSRPYGYGGQLKTTQVTELAILQLVRDQVKEFVYKWYLANELARSSRTDNYVETVAREHAEDLLKRLDARNDLTELAVNPLLVTMIATVHSSKGVLPGRRVGLYGEIFRVVLARRAEFWQAVNLDPEQVMEILKPLGYYMMEKELRYVPFGDCVDVVKQSLTLTGATLSAREFIKAIDDQSGLFREVRNKTHAFAHLSLQEYLASVFILDDRTGRLQEKLIGNISESWWAETIRLYAAQTDATQVVSKCLTEQYEQAESSSDALSLAIDCVGEALKLQQEVRQDFEQLLNSAIESKIPEQRKRAAQAILSSRTRWMIRLDGQCLIDTDLIFNVEYKLFVDEMAAIGVFVQPDVWLSNEYPERQGRFPVAGVRSEDAKQFCEWLTRQDIWSWRFRVPYTHEVEQANVPLKNERQSHSYWYNTAEDEVSYNPSAARMSKLYFTKEDLVQTINGDLDRLYRLGSAYLRRKTPNRPTSDLLANVIPMQGGGSELGRRRASGVEQTGRPRSSKDKFDDALLLKSDESCAEVLSVDLERVVVWASQCLLLREYDRSRSTLWLSGSPGYSGSPVDLGVACRAMRHQLDITTAKSYPDDIREQLDDLRITIEFLESRSWVQYALPSKQPSSAKIYEFLRWLVRLELLLYGVNLQQHVEVREDSVNYLQPSPPENLLVDLARLEKWVGRKQGYFGGIRIVKYQIGSGTNIWSNR